MKTKGNKNKYLFNYIHIKNDSAPWIGNHEYIDFKHNTYIYIFLHIDYYQSIIPCCCRITNFDLSTAKAD